MIIYLFYFSTHFKIKNYYQTYGYQEEIQLITYTDQVKSIRF